MTPCPNCGSTEHYMGFQYGYPHPERIDGVSEWHCLCGVRIGRWSGKLLQKGEVELRYGRKESSE